MSTIWWLGIFIVLVIIEIVTVDLVSIWFIVGALGSTFASLITDDLFIQLMVFVIGSLGTLLCTRKIFNKVKTREMIPTNLDRIIGFTGEVTEDITNHSGEVKVDGKRWSATSDSQINVGSKVEILAIDGVKLRVRKKEEDE